MDMVTNEVADTSSLNFEGIYLNLYNQINFKASQVISDVNENDNESQILFIAKNYVDFNLDFSKKGKHDKKNSDEVCESSFKCAGTRKIGEMDMFLQKAGDTTSKKAYLNNCEIQAQLDMQSSNTVMPKKMPKKM